MLGQKAVEQDTNRGPLVARAYMLDQGIEESGGIRVGDRSSAEACKWSFGVCSLSLSLSSSSGHTERVRTFGHMGPPMGL